MWIGIDGGGTHTRAVLVDDAGRVRQRADAGPGNALTAGYEVADASIAEVLSQLPPEAPLVLALAGADRPRVAQHWQEVLERLHRGPHWLVGDYRAAWAALTEGHPGTLAIVGTGSVVYGEARDGATHRVGGYGWRFGDSGSGLWLATAAVRSGLQAWEGHGPDTRLKEICQRIASTPAGVLAWAYAPEFRPEVLAGLAPEVAALAEAGDVEAVRLMRQGAAEIAGQVQAVHTALDLGPKNVIGVSGGFSTALMPYLQVAFWMRRLPAPAATRREPAEGAAFLARRWSEGD